MAESQAMLSTATTAGVLGRRLQRVAAVTVSKSHSSLRL